MVTRIISDRSETQTGLSSFRSPRTIGKVVTRLTRNEISLRSDFISVLKAEMKFQTEMKKGQKHV